MFLVWTQYLQKPSKCFENPGKTLFEKKYKNNSKNIILKVGISTILQKPSKVAKLANLRNIFVSKIGSLFTPVIVIKYIRGCTFMTLEKDICFGEFNKNAFIPYEATT